MKKISIIGSGAWGTALAITSHNAKNDVLLWSHTQASAEAINKDNENRRHLAGIKLPQNIKATHNLKEAVQADILLLVVPSQKLRETCVKISLENLPKKIPLVICCKGIEQGSHKLMSEVVKEILPHNPVAVLSGPNFAAEIAKGLPACATLACEDEKIGADLVESLASRMFRLYYTHDVIGAQVGGAVKNVIAIACGIAIGKGLGENAAAALVTRGMAEISRLCLAKGGKLNTLMGLSGIGDIMLTCGSKTSRNMSLGLALGRGEKKQHNLTEGVATAASVTELAGVMGIDMPICSAINEILHKGADIDAAIKALLERPFAVEVV
jgi:glycerol-3-phosphate dehydrogenase (NAD(P)+)